MNPAPSPASPTGSDPSESARIAPLDDATEQDYRRRYGDPEWWHDV